MKEENKNNKVKKQNSKSAYWSIKIFVLAVALSLAFSVMSEFLMSSTGIIVAIIVIVVFVAIAIITDMIGVAVTACAKEPFIAMCSRKVRGAKEGLFLIKNADKVASLCADVVGDVCGILSGAGGASITLRLTSGFSNNNLSILVASVVTALIAGITIFGKSLGKKKAINDCNNIILNVGKFLSIFRKQNPKPNQKTKEKSDNPNNQN